MLTIFIFLKYSLSRTVRLKHPKKDLFVGGKDWYPTFVEKSLSGIFKDTASEGKPGRILIDVQKKSNMVWDIEGAMENLIFYPKHGGKNQQFKVIHIARDVISIKSILNKCVTFEKKLDRFVRKKCKISDRNQIFLITNIDGEWKGSGNLKKGWGNKDEEDVDWGNCPDCVPGGFGSEKQGKDFDAEKNLLDEEEGSEESDPEEMDEAIEPKNECNPQKDIDDDDQDDGKCPKKPSTICLNFYNK